MRTYVIIVVSGMLIIFGILLYPTLHSMVGDVSTTGFLPLTTDAVILMPYAFMGFVFYLIMKLVRR